MKTFTKAILIICFAILLTDKMIPQTAGDYRSKGSGPWTTLAVWDYYNGSEWVAATETPTSASGIITILPEHTITLSSGTNITIDQVGISAGASLTVSSGASITVNDGSGENDIVVNGTLNISGSVHGAGKVVINGTCNWNYSRFSNHSDYDGISNTNFNIGASGIMYLNGSETKWFHDGDIYNSGTITIPSGAGNFHGVNGAAFHNQSSGVVNVQSDGKIYSSSQSGFWSAGFTFNNAGTLRKRTGSGTAILEKLTFTNTGTVIVENGILNINCGNSSPGHTGTFTLTEGTTLILDGNSEQNLGEGSVINGIGTVQIVNHNTNLKGETNGTTFGPGVTLEFSSGTIGGPGKATINGTMNWTGGELHGTLIIPEGVQLNLGGSIVKTIWAGKIYNSGTLIYSGSGEVFGVSDALIENQSTGTFDIQNDARLFSSTWSGGPTPTFNINNAGTIKKSAGSGTTTIERVTLTNTGTLQVQIGTLLFGNRAILNNTGTLQVYEGTICSVTGENSNFNNFSSNTLNSGTYSIAGTFKFNNANITTNNANIILDGAAAQILDASDADALANFAINGGSFVLTNGRNFSTNATTFDNEGTLNCGSNIFSGSGSFTNASGSTLIIGSPDGITSSDASGNIQSTGTRTFSTGANYTYNGNTAQVTGNGFPAQVNNLTINNSNSLSLTSDVAIAGTFTLTDGNINTESNTITLGTGTSTLGALERTSGTIIGNFKRWFANSTVENVLFPVGTASNYRSANISFTTAPSSGGTITASFATSNPGTTGLPITDDGATIENIGSDGYWTLTTADDFNGGTYNLDLTADGFAGVSNYTELHLLKRSNSGSNWSVEGIHSVCTGSNSCPIIHRTELTSFSEFGVGSTSVNPLPVELTSFSADTYNNHVILNWSTATEVKNYGFEVERTSPRPSTYQGEGVPIDLDGRGWEKIGFVKGSGTSLSNNSYSFIDENPPTGEVHYRLKQIDTDGESSYSDAVAVVFNKEIPQRFLLSQNYPNPFNPVTNINYNLPVAAVVDLRVFDILGKEITVIVDNELQDEGVYNLKFDAVKHKLSSGIYFYQIKAGEFSDVKKLILSK